VAAWNSKNKLIKLYMAYVCCMFGITIVDGFTRDFDKFTVTTQYT
jgi:hypothetical protein